MWLLAALVLSVGYITATSDVAGDEAPKDLAPSPTPTPCPTYTIFEATDEWQLIEPCQHITAGLDVRMDLSAGLKWAKKIEKAPKKGDGAIVAAAPSSSDVAVVVVDPEGGIAGSEVLHAAPAAPAGAGTQGAGEAAAPVLEAPSDSDSPPADGLDGPTRDKRDILLGLPLPEPDLQDAVTANLPPEELAAIVQRVWDRRQAELMEAFKSTKTEGQQMQGLLKSLLTGEAEGQFIDDGTRIGILLDLEFFVTTLHNAEDFLTMGGLSTAVSLLNDTSLDVALHAAWVVGSAVKYAPALQRAAVEQEGAVAGLLQLIERATSEHVLHTALITSSDPGAVAVWGGEDGKPVVIPLAALSRSVYALAGLLRGGGHHDLAQASSALDAQRVFIGAGGVDALTRLLGVLEGTMTTNKASAAFAANPTALQNLVHVARQARGIVAKTFALLRDLQDDALLGLGADVPSQCMMRDAAVAAAGSTDAESQDGDAEGLRMVRLSSTGSKPGEAVVLTGDGTTNAAAGAGGHSNASPITVWSFSPLLEHVSFNGDITPSSALEGYKAATRQAGGQRFKIKPASRRKAAVNTITGGKGKEGEGRLAARGVIETGGVVVEAVGPLCPWRVTGPLPPTHPTAAPPLCAVLGRVVGSMTRSTPVPPPGTDGNSVDTEILASLSRSWASLSGRKGEAIAAGGSMAEVGAEGLGLCAGR